MSEIALEDHGSKRRYVVRHPDGEAELTLSVLSPDRVIADHTFVPDSLRGRGFGRALVEALVADARAQGFTILPLCPFVAAQARRHPDWAPHFDR